MKKFFSNFFNKNNDPTTLVSFDVINSIYLYLSTEENSVAFKVKGFPETVDVNLYSFPNSFNSEYNRKQIVKNCFRNAYEVLNELYKKIGIGIISEKEIQAGVGYDFIHIQFCSQPPVEMRKDLKFIFHNFIIFLCCTNSTEINNFKMLYSNSSFSNYIGSVLVTEAIDIKDPKNEFQKIGFKEFETILQAICQYMKIELPSNITLSSQENLLARDVEITQENFEEFIKLVSRGNIEEKKLKRESKKLFTNFNKEPNDDNNIVDGHFNFFESIDAWNSDWKFDPEDAEYFISEMIGEDLNFDYPEETYSHDLFPYIQSALEKRGLELMSYDTHGDNYLFFVANKNDVPRILQLSELTKIEVDSL